MRISFNAQGLLTSVCLISLTPLSGFANPRPVHPTAQQQEAAARQRVDAMQQKLDAHMRVLQQRLAEADQMRQTALRKNDSQMLKRAEQVERQAIEQYQRQVQQTEHVPQRTRPTPPLHGYSTGPAPQPSVNKPAVTPPAKQRQPQSQKRSRWPRFRLWRPFGGN